MSYSKTPPFQDRTTPLSRRVLIYLFIFCINCVQKYFPDLACRNDLEIAQIDFQKFLRRFFSSDKKYVCFLAMIMYVVSREG